MMVDEDEAGLEYDNFFVDLYGRYDTRNFSDELSFANKGLGLRLANLLTIEPRSLVDHEFSPAFLEGLTRHRYEDSITIINKGLPMKLVRIPNVFTSLDLSSNNFEGTIPDELMNLKALYVLNLSQNTFSGSIPSSIGNLNHLESLDLSNNTLSSEILIELASLSFLSFLDLSFNHLVGMIPTGTQLQSFEASSFEGNDGLCGPPLTYSCNAHGVQELSSQSESFDTGSSIDWNFLSVELGFTFGLGLVILPLIFWKRWKLWYCKHIDQLLCSIIPQLHIVDEHDGKKCKTLWWKPH